MVAYDGANWWAWTEPIVPVTFGAVAHEFLTAYNAATGAWTAAQPAFSDISGSLSTSQLPSAGLSVTITTAKLTTLGPDRECRDVRIYRTPYKKDERRQKFPDSVHVMQDRQRRCVEPGCHMVGL